jgi:outer membrane protein
MVSMKKLTILSLAVLGMLSLVSMKSFAQKIGVVDGNKVLESYTEYQTAQTKLQGIIKSWQDSLGVMQKAAKDKFDSYSKIKETMSKEAISKADEELQKMQTDMQNYNLQKTDQQKGEIIKVRSDLMDPIIKKVKEAIEVVAKKKKIEIIMDKGNLAYIGEGVTDITADVSTSLKK